MAGKDKGAGNSESQASRWHAVSVKPCGTACNAAVSGKNRRWLSREAPMLPLPGCTQPDTCRCTYQHHDDRRARSRRSDDVNDFSQPPRVVNERRSRKSRRTTGGA
ncbi:MAG: hypothetical protein ACREVI_02080 [Steroidobacteraceae bacterium]